MSFSGVSLKLLYIVKSKEEFTLSRKEFSVYGNEIILQEITAVMKTAYRNWSIGVGTPKQQFQGYFCSRPGKTEEFYFLFLCYFFLLTGSHIRGPEKRVLDMVFGHKLIPFPTPLPNFCHSPFKTLQTSTPVLCILGTALMPSSAPSLF